MRETILVTGSAGFIGFHICQRLLDAGHQVVGLDSYNNYYQPAVKEARGAILRARPGFTERRLQLEDAGAVSRAFSDFPCARVCHLAAQAGVRYSLVNPAAYERSNLAGFLNVLEAARHHGVRRLVYASSSSVYGGNKKIPFSEDDPVDNPISLYAATKKANELMAHCYTRLFGIQTVGLRFFTVYGPWGRPDMAMWLFAEAIAAGRPIKVFNNGRMRRDFTYIDDIVSGVVAALFADGLDAYEIFNLGNHRSEPLLDMIALVESAFGRVAEKLMLPLQPGDVPDTFADISRAQAKLGFSPATHIAEGVARFVQWYKEHGELAALVRDTRGQFTN